MTNDLAKTIAAACLEAIQARPDTPTEDELADVVRPYLSGDQRPEDKSAKVPTLCPHGDCGGDLMFRCWDGTWKCTSCGGPANPTDEAW